ncbi:MAG: nucleotidyltransferase, partial [Calditrichaeota bacterium]|nr:nucleotidyltransferase [Calditrichota bacterium]
MTLDLTSLKKAIHALERSLSVAKNQKLELMDEDLRETVRAGIIQNFKVA